MSRLFGTDGVRGVANHDLTPDLALALGRAAGSVLAPAGGHVVVGRDTRLSGPMLEAALLAGLCSAGVDVHRAGIIPTPAVAFLTLEEKAAAGAVISASHNPVADNGIKFFSPEAMKISGAAEEEIEAAMESPTSDLPVGSKIGTVEDIERAGERYVDHLIHTLHEPLRGLRVVLDCAFGAAYDVAPSAFREAGADVIALHAENDGARINVDCGSTALGKVAERVVHEGADLGIAFDGDADRAIGIDERGEVVDGDRIIALSALHLKEAGELDGDLVIGTVMANLGFRHALEARGIDVVTVPVGDKYVAEAMAERGAALGGEQSGHVIFGNHSTTGDGILTGLQVAAAVAASGATLSDLAFFYETYPQVLANVRVAHLDRLDSAAEVWGAVEAAERRLGSEGRVLVRASGTEPLVRVMVEAIDEATARRTAERLATVVDRALA